MSGSKGTHQPVNCRRCHHYFVTWEGRTPHGCKALKFKSRYLPSQVVQRTSGQPCLNYFPKPPVPRQKA
jgi:hypothetical protein